MEVDYDDNVSMPSSSHQGCCGYLSVRSNSLLNGRSRLLSGERFQHLQRNQEANSHYSIIILHSEYTLVRRIRSQSNTVRFSALGPCCFPPPRRGLEM